jgi:sorting nexin-17
MHFSIPETVAQPDDKGGAYTGYRLHINGVYHCLVRYRQLHTLHLQLRRELPAPSLPAFPPKKLFHLTEGQVEERRLLLERYLQLVSQDPRVSNSQTFNTFLLAAQQETRRERSESVSLDVFLMNEHKISLTILTVEQTDAVLEQVCKELNIPDDLIYCFSLFLIRRDEDGDITIVRKLQDFESPYISQKALSALETSEASGFAGPLKIVLRKSSWDASLDDRLLVEQPTLNLLFIQAVVDMERGWILPSAETKQQLALMQARGSKRQFMEVARTLPFYGFLVFRPAITDHPEEHTQVTVSLGRASLNMRLHTPSGDTREVSFKVTRMRCWRIMTTEARDQGNLGLLRPEHSRLELSFEYLVTADRLEWITIVSHQAILMSMCLQSMVEELVRIRGGEREPARVTRCEAARPAGPRAEDQSPEVEEGCGGPVDYTVRKLAERFSVVNMMATSKAAEDVFVENEVFNSASETEAEDVATTR